MEHTVGFANDGKVRVQSGGDGTVRYFDSLDSALKVVSNSLRDEATLAVRAARTAARAAGVNDV